MSKPRMLLVSTGADLSLDLFFSPLAKRLIEPQTVMFSHSKEEFDRVMQTDFQYVYFRDPFNVEQYSTEKARANTSRLLRRYKSAYFVDGISSFGSLLFEDKWQQFKKLSDIMPPTQVLTALRAPNKNEFIKKRLSARSKGVIFDFDDYPPNARPQDYIVQQRLDIKKEYRAYVIGGEIVKPLGIKSSKTKEQNLRLIGLQEQVSESILEIGQALYDVTRYDFCGLDIAETKEGFFLLEINRSPQFKKYWQLTSQNLAALLNSHLLTLH